MAATLDSLGPFLLGAGSMSRLAAARTFTATAPSMVGGKGLVALEIGTLIALISVGPVLGFLHRHLFCEWRFLTKLDRLLRLPCFPTTPFSPPLGFWLPVPLHMGLSARVLAPRSPPHVHLELSSLIHAVLIPYVVVHMSWPE
jgi:hypothetical protein